MKKLILTHSPSAGGTIRQLLRSNPQKARHRVEAGFDNFSHGPIDPDNSVEEFCQIRQAFWNSFGLADVNQAYSFDYLSELLKTFEAVQRADQVEFWCSQTVPDQLYFTVMLRLLEIQGVKLDNCRVRQMTNQDCELGLGCLDFKRLGEILDDTDAVEIDTDLYREAWHVLAGQKAENINEFVHGKDASEPITKAFGAFLLRFPEFNGGLGSIDRALLGAGSEEVRKSGYTIGTAMALGEPTIDRIGDWILSKRLVELSEVQNSPWFEIEGDPRTLRHCSVWLTASGQQAKQHFLVKSL